MMIRSTSSSVTSSDTRLDLFVVFDDACETNCRVVSSVPSFRIYAVIRVAPNVCQQIRGLTPAAIARRLIMRSASLRCMRVSVNSRLLPIVLKWGMCFAAFPFAAKNSTNLRLASGPAASITAGTEADFMTESLRPS